MTKITKEKSNERFYQCLFGDAGIKFVNENPDIINNNINEYFNAMKNTMEERELIIIKKRFGIDCNPMTLKDIAKELNVTDERIRQIEARAIRKLKHPTRSIVGYPILLKK